MNKLEWDTDFWGIDIFHLDSKQEIRLENIQTQEAPFLIQTLVNVQELKWIHLLEEKGFHFVENKITLEKNLGSFAEEKNHSFSFKNATLNDVTRYQNEFSRLFGQVSRYSMFPEEKVNQFYYTWVINSIKGEMDDACVGVYVEKELAGFVTYRVQGNKVVIGLLGVFSMFQGKGISQALLDYVNNLAIQKEISTVQISTQGKNLAALNAYIKNGYKMTHIDHWYNYTKGVPLHDPI